MQAVLEVTLPVFALVFCGYVAAGRKMLPDKAVEGINAFVFRFALPAMLFRVIALRPIGELIDWRYTIGYVVAAMAVYIGIYKLARRGKLGGPPADGAHAAAVSLHVTHGNVGYLGLALVAEVSAQALPTVALTIILDIIVIVVLSMVLMELQRGRERAGGSSPWVPVFASLSRSPLVLSMAAGLVVSAGGWQLPTVVDNFTRLLGGAAGPGALFAIGASLGGARLRFDREIWALLAAKLVLYPVAVAISLFLIFRPDPFVAAIGVLCATLPGASNSFIIAQRYGVPTGAIGAATAAGTALSVLTVSLAIWLLGLR